MIRGDLSATGILNAVGPRLREVQPAAISILLLTALPLRLLQIHFIGLLIRLRGDAPHYGNLLIAFSSLTVVAFIVSLYGRAVFIRAMYAPSDSVRRLLRVHATNFLTYVYVALMIEIAFALLSVTVIGIPLLIILAGVAAAATVDPARPGIVAPLRALGRYLTHGRVLGALIFVLSVAYFVALINLVFFARTIMWMAGAVPSFDSLKWSAALGHSSRYVLALLAGAATVVEPFFLTAMHVYAERVRARESGDDLLFRFRALTSQKMVAAVVVTMVLLAVPLIAQGQAAGNPFTTAEYVQDLTTLRDAYVGTRYSLVAPIAEKLDAINSISNGSSRFEPDHALLRQVKDAAQKSKLDLVLAGRLSATIDALGTRSMSPVVRKADAGLLARIRAEEKTGELARGGELAELTSAKPTIGDEIERIFNRVIAWLASKLERLFDLIGRLWPAPRDKDPEQPSFLGISVVVWIVTLFIVATLLTLAAYVLRRSKWRTAPVTSTPIAESARDADPLSRESNEWERYANELAARGLLREAIRAWYHAVLVTLYRGGLLHYRKGMTNWEYVSALSPSLEWRPSFISMTRRFDREWYGRRDTTPDVLDGCVAEARVILGALHESR